MIWFILLVGLFFAIPPYRSAYARPEEPEPLIIPKPTIQEYAKQEVIKTFGGQWTYFEDLVDREGKWNKKAQNPHSTAYGIGQFLNGTWDDVGCVKTSDPYIQIDCMIKYVKARYGNPQKAIAFHNLHGYY